MQKYHIQLLFIFFVKQNFLSGKIFKHTSVVNDIFTDRQCCTGHFRSLFDESKYKIEDHTVKTEDGYLLKMFKTRLKDDYIEKLPESDKKNVKKPVMIIPGLQSSADDYFIVDQSTGFHFVNKGFDVWLGNNRGNKYSKSHVNKHITRSEFYDFSFQEMGLKDLPAMYDKVLDNYKDPSTKIIYVGESQGTTQFFVGGSDDLTKDYIRSKTSRFFAIDPVAYMTKANYFLTIQPRYTNQIYKSLEFFQIYDFTNWGCIDADNKFVKRIEGACKNCHSILKKVWDPALIDLKDIVGKLVTHMPSGSNHKSAVHFSQLIKGDENGDAIFRKFDYGSEEENIKRYNQKAPPDWDLQGWDIPTAFINGGRDPISTIGNTNAILSKLDPKFYNITWIPEWNHGVFNFVKDPSEMYKFIDRTLSYDE